MAIYHLSMQIISRSKGQSAVASASYRSGERLVDERTGEIKFYSRDVQPETMILAPTHSPSFVYDREQLWNEVEKVEKRKDSQLAREMNIALPKELSNAQQKELIQNFIQDQFVDKGMIADVAIHRDDKENPHAHVMLTMRDITPDGFGKKNRDWNANFANSKENNKGFVKSADGCLNIREEWANYANEALEKANVKDRITHLSHEARGLEQLPTVHLGHVASEMEKKGKESERGNINREIKEYNSTVIDLEQYRQQKKELEQAIKKSTSTLAPEEKAILEKAKQILEGKNLNVKGMNERLEQLGKWSARIDREDSKLREKTTLFRKANEEIRWIKSFEKRIESEKETISKAGFFDRKTKQIANNEISRHQDLIKLHESELQKHLTKLGISDVKTLNEQEKNHSLEYETSIEKHKNQRNKIKHDKDILNQALAIYKDGVVRQTASKYPDNPEVNFMKYEDVQKLNRINNGMGRVVPIQEIKEATKQMEKAMLNPPTAPKEQERLNDALGLFSGVVNAVEQANKNMEKQHSQQNQKQKKKQKHKELGMELGG